jgi:hypothetical protein
MKKNLLEKIEKKVYLKILYVVLTLAFGFIGLYAYLHTPKPSILFETISESNVLDVHKPLENLKIYFKNEDIQKKNLNLRIITIKISNNGEVNILQSSYDQKLKWGFKISNGKIINDAKIISSNSEYLKENLSPKVVGDNIVELEKVIFEKGNYFTIELLVLHKKDLPPQLSYIGKIAGIENINPIKTWEKSLEPNIFKKFFYGGLLINVMRPIIYSICIIFLIIIIVLSYEGFRLLKDKLEQERRKKEIVHLLGGEPQDEKIKMITDIYIRDGVSELNRIKALISNEKELKRLIKLWKLDHAYYKKRKEFSIKKGEVNDIDELTIHPKFKRYWHGPFFDDLLDKKVIEFNQQDDEIIIDSDFMKTLSMVVNHFKSAVELEREGCVRE